MAMKIILAVTSGITARLLQATLIGPLSFPVPVSLPLLLVAVVAIYAGPGVGVGMGFSIGLVADLGSDHPAGVQALCWLGAGALAGIVGGLLARRGFAVRQIAAVAALICALTQAVCTLLLTVLDSHGASLLLAVRDTVPVALMDSLLALALVPIVAAVLRVYGVRAPRALPATGGYRGA
jgi:rod shape-determining protein MreD